MSSEFSELRELFQLANARLDKMHLEAEKRRKDSDQRFEKEKLEAKKRREEFDRRLKKQQLEADKRREEFDRRFEKEKLEAERQRKDFDRRWNKLENLFTGQWGKLIEALVKPGAVELFCERGIDVTEIHQRIEIVREKRRVMEIDLLLKNSDEMVIIEVKSTLKVEDVRDFLEKMARFRQLTSHKYEREKIYGAMAGINIAGEADRYAYKKGLFVLSMASEGVIEILNDEKFTPKTF